MYEYSPIANTKENLRGYLRLFSACFPREKKFSFDYLEWLYFKNPTGDVLGFDARFNNSIIAHYAAIPCETSLNGVIERTLLSINTSTHPFHVRKGLFLNLAKKTYDAGRQLGFKSVIGVANKNATPGRLKYLNFTLISPLSVKIGISSLNMNEKQLFDNDPFRVEWSKEALNWRLNFPKRNVSIKRAHGHHTFYSKRTLGLFVPYSESPFIFHSIEKKELHTHLNMGIKLFVGLLPKKSLEKNLFFKLPEIIKPVPLNFIYKRLDHKKFVPDRNNIFFNFLDFDIF